MPRTTYYSRMGAATDFTQPVVGSASIYANTPIYQAAMFGNGFKSLCQADGGVPSPHWDLPSGIVLWDYLTIEYWFYRTHAIRAYGNHLNEAVGATSTTRSIRIQSAGSNGGNPMQVTIWNNSTGGVYWIGTIAWHTLFPLNTQTHFAFTYNKDAGTDATKIVTYINGVSTGETFTFGTFGGGTTADLVGKYLSTERISGFNDNDTAMNGIMDNFKIYNFVKTNFSDRFRERSGMNDLLV